MGKLYCPEDGGHEVKVRFSPTPGERFCPTHRCSLRSLPKKPGKGLTNGLGRREMPAETRARQHFNRVVTSRRCYFADTTFGGKPRRPGHRCNYPLDAHHLLPKEWMRRELALPEDELLAVMYDPIIGAPLCRAAHAAVERRTDFIYFEELDDDLIAICERFDAQHPKCPSLLERLKLESPPQRKEAAPAVSGRSSA